MQKEVLESILDKARFAPSADNLQPWIFKVHENTVHLWLDDSRLNSYCDAAYLAPYISAGAALENIRVAASFYSYTIEVEYFPLSDEPRRVADICFRKTDCEGSVHYEYLEKRHTNRNFYRKNSCLDRIVYQRLEKQLPENSGFRLLWKHRDENGYDRVARMIGAADQLRFEIKRLHHELMDVVRFTKEETENTRDGLSLPSLEISGASAWVFRTIRSWKTLETLNRIGMSRSFNLYAQRQIKSSASTGLLVARSNSPESFVRGGEIFQRIWHEATLNGLAIQPMEALPIFFINSENTQGGDLNAAQKKKLAELKKDFYSLFDAAPEEGLIFLFRIGEAAPVSGRTLRKPLEHFLQYQNEKAGSSCR